MKQILTTRRKWLAVAGGSVLAMRLNAQQKFLPMKSSGLDHLSITVPDPLATAKYYGPIFDPQVFHERTGVQRYYVRLGAAYIALGPQPNVTPYIDHIAAALVGFDEEKFGDFKAEFTAAAIPATAGTLNMVSNPDNLRIQLVNAQHGLYDTLMPGGRVTVDPPVFMPIGLDHIMVSVSDVEKAAEHYRKLFGAEERERNPQRLWFKLADTKLGVEAAPAGQKPSFSHFCVKVAAFDRSAAMAKLQKLGVKAENGTEKGTIRFRDLNNISVEVVGA